MEPQLATLPRARASSPRPDTCLDSIPLRFRLRLRRYFEKHGVPRDEVDDLVQDVFLRLATRTHFESPTHLEAYIFRSAANLLHDRHRRQVTRATARHEAYEEDIHGSVFATPGPDRVVHSAQRLERLLAALEELPERTRKVFTLYHLEDLPHRKIAERLGIAVSTIEKHMARANVYLMARVEP